MSSKYYKPFDSPELVKTPEITTKQFDFDRENGLFVSDAKRLLLLPNERFAFFMMRGKTRNITFSYTGTETIEDTIWDLYTATVEPFFECRIKRKTDT